MVRSESESHRVGRVLPGDRIGIRHIERSDTGVTCVVGTATVLNTVPLFGLMTASLIGEVTPKLPSTEALFQTST
jgi:hypothetical protein